jgi:hypothetical protein
MTSFPTKTLNTLISSTNLFGIIPIYIALNNNNYIGALITFCAMFASILYHISETHHNLTGLIFTKYTNYLLFIDRIFAIIALVYGIYLIYINNYIYYSIISINIIIGIFALLLSELFGNYPIIYTLFHCIWHCVAFIILALII